MKFKNVMLSLILGLTVSGAVTAAPETPSRNLPEDSGFFLSTETDMPDSENGICPLSDVDIIESI